MAGEAEVSVYEIRLQAGHEHMIRWSVDVSGAWDQSWVRPRNHIKSLMKPSVSATPRCSLWHRAITRLRGWHPRLSGVSQSYLGLISGALAVCLRSFSAFPHGDLRTFLQVQLLRQSLSSPYLSVPGYPLPSPSSIHRISHVLTRLSDTSDCVGVRSDQNLPVETLRAQRHPMAATPTGTVQVDALCAVGLGAN